MILGLSVETFALIHEIISIVGILSGLAVAAGLMIDTWLPRANILFLATTIATSVTGFMFHSQVFGAPQIIGVVSLIVLAVAMLALYRGKLSGFWKQTYVVAPVLALYLNALVFVVQAFQKVPFLNAFAPKGRDLTLYGRRPSLRALQSLFCVLEWLALVRFRSCCVEERARL
jgi:hypothetical protein